MTFNNNYNSTVLQYDQISSTWSWSNEELLRVIQSILCISSPFEQFVSVGRNRQISQETMRYVPKMMVSNGQGNSAHHLLEFNIAGNEDHHLQLSFCGFLCRLQTDPFPTFKLSRIKRFYILSRTMAVDQSITISILLTIELLIFVFSSINHHRLCFRAHLEYDHAFSCNKWFFQAINLPLSRHL